MYVDCYFFSFFLFDFVSSSEITILCYLDSTEQNNFKLGKKAPHRFFPEILCGLSVSIILFELYIILRIKITYNSHLATVLRFLWIVIY